MQQLVKEGRVKLRKIPGEENSSDLGTKYLERLTFEKHRCAAGLKNRGGDNEQDHVNAIEHENPNHGDVMAVTGVARCFAGILGMMQVKSVGAGRDELEDEPTYQMNDYSGMSSFTFILHVILLAMAFAWGYRLGQAQRQTTEATRSRAQGVHASTNTYEIKIRIELEDMTVEALRTRLRELHCGVSGTKAELKTRLQAAMHHQRLRAVVSR